MAISTLSSREFSQDTSRAKQASYNGLSSSPTAADQKLTGGPMKLADALAQPETSDFEFDPPKIKGRLSKPVDLS